ncbi:substrate-binding periplasmic protein [Alkalimarinus sediminis]|uniref:ABC transporter substrate-binding protein n=1 Tax=Alkalimarinus sediminis TaxID=1632866 RepID=A0A9E8HJ05_9ALTE|nr:ABC transporter substrate-binding protein [Alkalimarinus sediminis]UZW75568.1 ABC transporter substrate-binding protein [Alkalimarinus sediminis]
MNKWVLGVVFGITALIVAGCANFGSFGRVINVGMATNYAPLAFEKDGQLQGMEVDFANALGESLNASVNIKAYSWEALLEALNNGEIDVVMSGVSITEKRQSMMLFTEPYMEIGQMAIIRTEDAGHLANKAQLMSGDYRVGYSRNTTGQKFVTEQLKNAEQLGFANTKEGVEALVNKQIDYFIHDAPTVWQLTSSYPTDDRLFGLYAPLTDEYLAWAVKTDNETLQQELNTVLNTWKENGFLQRTLSKWIPVSVVLSKPGE